MKSESTILACTDGSIYAESVYDHASWAAHRLGSKIHVLHMIDPRHDPGALHNFSGSIGLDARQNLKEELVKLEEAHGRAAQAKATAILDAARNHLRESGCNDFSVEAVHGHLVESIEEFDAKADIVVIGKRGEAANFEKLHLGANVERVIRSCHHPVLVAARAFQPIQRVLVAFDGGPSCRKAVDFMLDSPLFREVEINLLAVGRPHPNIKEDLLAARTRLQGNGLRAAEFHQEGHPEEVFARFISQHGTNLLIMGAYGHSRIRQFIIGSTTTMMVRTCRIPILMFR